MPESEIHVLSTIESLDARPEDSSLGFKTQEEDIKRRINTLFGTEEKKEKVEETEDIFKKDDYETVNEGMTTDTTEAPTQQTKRTPIGEEGAAEKKEGEQEGEI